MAYFGLYALQHRGQESAGIAVARNGQVRLHKQMGLVSQAFTEQNLARLPGDLVVGHTRYSTTGSSSPENAGPMAAESDLGTIVVAHNGNLVNSLALHDELLAQGARLRTSTDSEVLTHLIARSDGITIVDKLRRALARCVGAYSLVVLTPRQIVAVRDPNGIRPLCLGRIDAGWIVASESCALATVGATFERELEPGEMLIIDEHGVRSESLRADEPAAMCVFELIYFARPDSKLAGQRVHLARQRMGAELWREQPADADVVVPVPDSAVPAAIGYARASGIPYSEALIKNRYIGRTFIQPDQRLREIGVALKFNALPEVVEGKRVVLVDDTIVRGTTSRPLVQLLRSAGASEVHMRVHAPPIMWPCYLGVDMASRDELIAANKTLDEIRDAVGADTLGYLSLEGLFRATGRSGEHFCAGCLTGRYPVRVDASAGKHALEVVAHAD
jgi:amidophosphoribosyltransferase